MMLYVCSSQKKHHIRINTGNKFHVYIADEKLFTVAAIRTQNMMVYALNNIASMPVYFCTLSVIRVGAPSGHFGDGRQLRHCSNFA